jgi:hypothetical protein
LVLRLSKQPFLINNTVGIITTPGATGVKKNKFNHVMVSAILHNETMSLGYGWYELNSASTSNKNRIIHAISSAFYDY